MSRLLALFAATSMIAHAAHAQTTDCAVPGTDNAFLGIHTVRLWAGPAPEAHGNGCDDIPTLTAFSAHRGNATLPAAIIFPGGAYVNLSGDLEGREVADWFTARGIAAFVVSYRLSSHGYILPVPLLDARRAIQTVRARAAAYHIDPRRIIVVGFSAGGHLAALAATKPVPGNPAATDSIDRVSSRPDYLVLGYPWIGAISTDTTSLSYCQLFKVMNQCDSLRAKYDPTRSVTDSTPPTFIYHTFDDRVVPIQQSLLFFEALIRAGVPSEYHVFARGSHGSGLGSGDPALDQWTVLLENWLRAAGLLAGSGRAKSPVSHPAPPRLW